MHPTVATVARVTGVEATERPLAAAPRLAPPRVARGRRWWRHWPLALVLVPALALRVLAFVAIYPGIWFTDSNGYVQVAATGTLHLDRVSGYGLLVAPFWGLGSAMSLILLQHAIGLGIVVALYALLVRRGVPRWLALLGVVPAALDAYLVLVEHAVMSETIYHAALVGAILLLLWSDRPRVTAMAAGGLLLGYAGVVRSVGVPLLAVFLLYLVVRRVGWRAAGAFCAGWLVVALGYGLVFHAQYGKLAFTESGGRFLYGKVAPFADCSRLHGLPADERFLCPNPGRKLTTNQYLWGKRSPIRGLPASADRPIRDFAVRVLRDKPLTYAGVVLGGFAHFFEPGHRIGANDYPVCAWQWPADPRTWSYPCYRGPIRAGDPVRRAHHHITEPNQYVGRFSGTPRLDPPMSRLLRAYQRVAYTWGPLLAVCVLLVVVALALRRGPRRLRLDAAFLAAVALAALLVSQALSLFSYRYGLVGAVLLPPAAAMAGASLLAGRARRSRSSVAIRPSAATTRQPA